MNISTEIQERLKFDQVVARAILLFLVNTYKQKPEDIAKKLEVEDQKLIDWFLERTEIGREDCWKIVELAEEEIVPLEWMIRGDILNEYDLELIVILAREFVRVASFRFLQEASPAETHEEFKARTEAIEGTSPNVKVRTALCLVVPSATTSIHEFSSWPGKRKMGLQIRILNDEQIQTVVYRIDEDEAQIGGDFAFSLPLIPEAITKGTLTSYDAHADHSFTYRDYLEFISMAKNGTVVANNYFRDCYIRAIEKQLPNHRKKITRRTRRTV